MRKAQLAVETLLIYGIALLIVMLAIGALIGFGVLDLGALLPESCSIQGAALNCENYFISKTAGNGFQLELSNNLGKNIQDLRLVRVYPENANDVGSLTAGCVPGAPIPFRTAAGTITPGSPQVSAATPLFNGNRAVVFATGCQPSANLKTGRKLNLIFEIRYQTSGSSLSPTATGKMRVTVIS